MVHRPGCKSQTKNHSFTQLCALPQVLDGQRGIYMDRKAWQAWDGVCCDWSIPDMQDPKVWCTWDVTGAALALEMLTVPAHGQGEIFQSSAEFVSTTNCCSVQSSLAWTLQHLWTVPVSAAHPPAKTTQKNPQTDPYPCISYKIYTPAALCTAPHPSMSFAL